MQRENSATQKHSKESGPGLYLIILFLIISTTLVFCYSGTSRHSEAIAKIYIEAKAIYHDDSLEFGLGRNGESEGYYIFSRDSEGRRFRYDNSTPQWNDLTQRYAYEKTRHDTFSSLMIFLALFDTMLFIGLLDSLVHSHLRQKKT